MTKTQQSITVEDLLADMDKLADKIIARAFENGNTGDQYDVNQRDWAAQIHYIGDLLRRLGLTVDDFTDRGHGKVYEVLSASYTRVEYLTRRLDALRAKQQNELDHGWDGAAEKTADRIAVVVRERAEARREERRQAVKS